MIRKLANFALAPLLSLSLGAQQMPQPSPTPAQTNSAELQPGDHVLQDGTPVKLQLAKVLSSADAQVGQEITFEVVDDITVDGVTVLRKGSTANGIVTEAVAKKRMGRAGRLGFNITSVELVDSEKVPLRAVNDTSGDSHVAGMTSLMISGVPMVAAPFLLLMHGEDTTFPKGTKLTAFVNGDLRLDFSKFPGGPPPIIAPAAPQQASLTVESTPPGADIEIDGTSVGITPSTIILAPGPHEIVVKMKGFAPWTRKMSIADGIVHLRAELETAPAQ